MAKDDKGILMSDKGLEDRIMKLGIIAFFLAFFVILLMVGHEGWLMYIHYQLLESFGINPSPQTYIDAMPTFVPLMLLALLALIAPCCLACIRNGKSRKENCVGLAVMNIVAAAGLTVLTYTIQIIVYLSKDVHYYLASLPQTAECHCHNETDLLYTASQQLYTCRCVLPLKDCSRTLVTADMNLLDDDALKGKGLSYCGDVITHYHNSSDLVDSALDFSNSMVTMMFVLTQISIVIIVIRFPLWIVAQNIGVLNKEKEKRAKLTTDKSSEDAGHCFRRNARMVVERIKIRNEIDDLKKINTHFAIEVCSYGFIEGVDAFSLLDEFLENGGYFAAKKALADTVLAFISINLLVVNVSNMLACIPNQTERINHGTKITVILISNVPFLIIRSYLFWLFGGLKNSEISSVFLLFLIKEVMVVLLTVVEVAVEVNHNKKSKQ